MSESLWSLTALWLLPLLSALLLRRPGFTAFPRRLAVAAAAVVLLLALAVFVSDGYQHAFHRSDVAARSSGLGALYHLGVDGLTAPLLPLTAALSLATLLAMPQAALAAGAAARVLFIEGMTLGALLSLNGLLLFVFWALALVPLMRALRGAAVTAALGRRLQRVYAVAVLLSVVPLGLAMLGLALVGRARGLAAPLDLLALAQDGQVESPWLGGLVILAALARLGCVPLHPWVAVAFAPHPERGQREGALSGGEGGEGPVALATVVTPLSAFLLARVVLPLFPVLYERAAPLLLGLGLVTAAYGALLALGQHDLRRLLGYFHVSQGGMVLAGMMALNEVGVSGSLLHAMGSLVTVTGLYLLALSIEARAGTCDMRLLGGLVQSAPRMATGMLLLAAAAVGFPGTIGFVSEDLLVQGLLRAHGLATGILLVVTAVNGIILYRAFKRTFLGAPPRGALTLESFADLLRREFLVAVALVTALLLGGFVPAPLLALREGVVAALGRVAPQGQGATRAH